MTSEHADLDQFPTYCLPARYIRVVALCVSIVVSIAACAPMPLTPAEREVAKQQQADYDAAEARKLEIENADYERAQRQEREQAVADQAKAARVQANPSGALSQYELQADAAAETLGTAVAASRCGLRSDEWLSAFTLGIPMSLARNRLVLVLSPEERTAADVHGQSVFAAAVAAHSDCQALVNSPEMDHLDHDRSLLTGGYQ